ncbi:MAG: hypothetical protein C7B43_11765 [Sulfobacillus benefaciens]|uniref:Uncharacterized protein n=1 Tax=Sulfobacillus benefaciens TaxID=453960 RepID=A0A2T2WYV8_9FIRM|nr:MAG: hypothetical protein C7B43_11765 [Sulfobacillus benefaciens]
MSATNILRHAWRHLVRNPGNLVLSFWYLFILFLFQLVAIRGLGSGFQQWLKALNPSKITVSSIPSLPHGLALKLTLTYLTMMLVVFPFVVGALYGGVADNLQTGSNTSVGLFAFFRYGFRLFWESLGLLVGIIVGTAVMLAVALLVNFLLAFLGQHALVLRVIMGIVSVLITLTLMFWWFAAVLYWMGAVYFGRQPVLQSLGRGLSWVWRHKGESLRLTGLTALLVLAATVLFSLFGLVPIIGQFFAIVLYAGVLTLIAIESNIFYREATRHDIPPVFHT